MQFIDLQDKPRKSNFNLYLATCAIDTIGIAIGCSLSWTSPTLPKLEVPNDRIQITEEESAWLGSLLCLGGALGPFINISLVNRIGRKYSLIIYTFFMSLSWIMLAFFNNIQVMYVARFVNGLNAGPASILIPMYISEISSADTRATTGSLFSIFIFFGCCIAYFIGPFTSYITLIGVSAAVTIASMAICFYVPESPYYLLDKGDTVQLYDTLMWLRGNPDKIEIQKEVEDMQEIVYKSHQGKANVSCIQTFLKWTNIKCFYYAFMLVFFQQMSGFSAVLFYSESLFQSTGSSFSSVASTMICGGVMLFTAALVPYFSKILRIKHILCLSGVGCSLFMGMLSAYFYMRDLGLLIPIFNLLPIISIVAFIIAFTLGISPFAGVIIVEILPTDVKVAGTAMLSSYCWFLSFLFARLFSTLNNSIGPANTFALFALINVFNIIYVTFQLPDTQGLTFTEIQDLIEGKKSISV